MSLTKFSEKYWSLPEKKRKRILVSITDSENPSKLRCEIWLVKSSYSKKLLLQIVLLLLITIIDIFLLFPSLFLFWSKCKTSQGTYCDMSWMNMRYRIIFYFIINKMVLLLQVWQEIPSIFGYLSIEQVCSYWTRSEETHFYFNFFIVRYLDWIFIYCLFFVAVCLF